MPRYSSYGSVQAPDIFGSFLQGQQARQQNQLAQMDMEKRQRVNALAGNPNASAEDYVRAGDVQTGSALSSIEGQKQQQQQSALTHLGDLARKAKTITDPMQRRQFIIQAAQVYGPHLQALGGDPQKSVQELQSMPDELLNQRIEQMAQYAPPEELMNVAPGGSVVSKNNPGQPLYSAPNPGQEETSRHNKEMERIGVLNAGNKPGNFRALSPQEVAARGLPPGTAAQIDENGKVDVLTKRDTTGVLSQKDSTAAKIKLNNVKTARQQLQRIKEAFAEGTSGAGANAFGGPLGIQGALPTQIGKKFDARVDQMRSTLTALTRTPGVGSMSDYETKLDQSKFPARGDYETVTADKLQGLDDLLSSIESGYTDLLSGGQQQGAQPAAPAASAASTNVPTATGPNGQKLYLRNGQWTPQ